jgi:hypothetical protein
MNERSSRISATLAAAWAALRRAFTSSRPPGALRGFEPDTTLFGGLSEQPRAGTQPRPAKDEFWEAGGESSYFAEVEPGRSDERR